MYSLKIASQSNLPKIKSSTVNNSRPDATYSVVEDVFEAAIQSLTFKIGIGLTGLLSAVVCLLALALGLGLAWQLGLALFIGLVWRYKFGLPRPLQAGVRRSTEFCAFWGLLLLAISLLSNLSVLQPLSSAFLLIAIFLFTTGLVAAGLLLNLKLVVGSKSKVSTQSFSPNLTLED